MTEVRTLTPVLRFRAPITPDADGNPVHYRIDLDTSETFASAGLISSPPMLVEPGGEGEWTVEGGMLADDSLYWWRVLAVDGVQVRCCL